MFEKASAFLFMIETERLILKLYEEKNHSDFIELFTDKKVMEFVDTGVFYFRKSRNAVAKVD